VHAYICPPCNKNCLNSFSQLHNTKISYWSINHYINPPTSRILKIATNISLRQYWLPPHLPDITTSLRTHQREVGVKLSHLGPNQRLFPKCCWGNHSDIHQQITSFVWTSLYHMVSSGHLWHHSFLSSWSGLTILLIRHSQCYMDKPM